MKLIAFGLNHRTAPLEVRESWALSAAEAQVTLGRLNGALVPSEHFVVSTCNRTEFYSWIPKKFAPGGKDPHRDVEANLLAYADFFRKGYGDLVQFRPAIAGSLDPSNYYVHVDEQAVEHLFRLASGLDSMILGESQILKQLKDSFTVARDSGAVGRYLHRLVPAALRTGKRVRSVTAISDGCITPGQAALRLARERLGDLTGKSLLVIGSGKIATSAALAFREAHLTNFVVVNRTASHAQELVEKLGCGDTAPWGSLRDQLLRADVIVSSTGAVQPIVDATLLEAVQEARCRRPLVAVDLAIPRDFAPECSQIPGVSLFNIDDLNRVIRDNVAERNRHVPLAEEIVREELSAFQRWQTYLQVDPVLRHMVERFEQIRLGELQAQISRFPPECHELLEEFSSSLCKKLLHFPIEKLKGLRDLRGLDETEVAFLKHLFLKDV